MQVERRTLWESSPAKDRRSTTEPRTNSLLHPAAYVNSWFLIEILLASMLQRFWYESNCWTTARRDSLHSGWQVVQSL